MKKITLTQGQFALVDDDDFEKVSKFKWYANKTPIGSFYAIRNIRLKNRRAAIKMHQFILNAKGIDHINGDTLDNRKNNLRICTNSQNQFNSKKRLHSSSNYKGVNWHKTFNKWCVGLQFNYKKYHIGLFKSEKDAAIAYNKKAKELFGEFARLNEV